jgi:hypothetical protein
MLGVRSVARLVTHTPIGATLRHTSGPSLARLVAPSTSACTSLPSHQRWIQTSTPSSTTVATTTPAATTAAKPPPPRMELFFCFVISYHIISDGMLLIVPIANTMPIWVNGVEYNVPKGATVLQL